MRVKDITLIGTLAILAAMVSFVEIIVTPIVPIPGMRLGLSNVVLLVALIHMPVSKAMLVAALKSVLVAIFSGSPTSFIYSFPSGLAAILLMSLAMKMVPKISYVGVSVIGAFINNLVQVFTSYLVLSSFVYFYYLPYITLVGTLMGTLIGFIINELERKDVLDRFFV